MLGTDQYRNISIETSDEPRTGKGSISISQTMHQGYTVFSVYKLVMLVVSGTCVLLEISNSVSQCVY